jgi:hypothetical protein
MPSTSSSSCTVPSSPPRPVQRDERDLRAVLAQPLDEVGADVDRDDLVPEPLERVLDARARLQRDLALERAPALEDGDARHAPRASHPRLRSIGRIGRRSWRQSRPGAGSSPRAVRAAARPRAGGCPVSEP